MLQAMLPAIATQIGMSAMGVGSQSASPGPVIDTTKLGDQLIGPFMGSIGSQAGAFAGQQVFGSGASGPDFGEQLRNMKQAMDELYPGTTPWERLGGNPRGEASANQDAQAELLKIQGENAQKVARIQGSAQVQSAAIASGATRDAATTAAEAPNRQATISEMMADPQIKKLEADTQLAIKDWWLRDAQTIVQRAQRDNVQADTVLKQLEASWYDRIAESQVTANEAKTIWQVAGAYVRDAVDEWLASEAGQVLRKGLETGMNPIESGREIWELLF